MTAWQRAYDNDNAERADWLDHRPPRPDPCDDIDGPTREDLEDR
jgi:hypothetical protein